MHREIKFERVGDRVRTPDPIGLNLEDTVRYTLDGGNVTVVFTGKPLPSPFEKSTIANQEVVKVVHPGHFLCQILIDGTFAKWTRGEGADHDVPKGN
jgi:hypothetical protein